MMTGFIWVSVLCLLLDDIRTRARVSVTENPVRYLRGDITRLERRVVDIENRPLPAHGSPAPQDDRPFAHLIGEKS